MIKWILIGLGIAFIYLLVFSMCKSASDADDEMDYIFSDENQLHNNKEII